MTRDVRDAALLLAVIAGSDTADPATAEADARRTDYPAALKSGALAGARIGVMRFAAGFHPETDAVFDQALARLTAAGAELVDIPRFPDGPVLGDLERVVLGTELKAGLNAYLATTPAKVAARTLADLIAFDKTHADTEMPLFGQEVFEAAQGAKGLDDPAYLAAKAAAHLAAGPHGIDAMLATYRVEALVAPTLGPAWLIDPVLRITSSAAAREAPPPSPAIPT